MWSQVLVSVTRRGMFAFLIRLVVLAKAPCLARTRTPRFPFIPAKNSARRCYFASGSAVWNYQTSPLFTAAERAALDVAVAAGCVPNAVTDEMFMKLRKHWGDDQVVEIVGVIAMFGFLNRWNDTFATPLEDEPLEFGEKHLTSQGWDAGRHRR